MAYIGREPIHGAFEKQPLTADSSTTTFTLNYVVGSSSSILVSVAGVLQEPEVAYNLGSGGTQIVFTAAPTTGDTCFVIFLSNILSDQNTPGSNSIQPSMMTSFNGVYENLQTITATTTVASTDNAFLAGPVTFTGTVTVEGNLTVV